MKAPFCPVFLLKLTPGQVLNKALSHHSSKENAHISVAPLHSYSRCEKYHGFYIEVLFYKGFIWRFLAKLRLFPSLRAPWTVHDVTDQNTRQSFGTELYARDMQGRVRWQALVLLTSPGSLSSL